LKFAHLILCGVAAFTVPAVAFAKDAPQRAAETTEANATPTPTATTLFPGALDMPVAQGSNVPSNCEFPDTLTSANLELACVVASDEFAEDEVGIEYISWLGENGFRHSADIIGGFAAARETTNGCEQTLRIYPHGDEGETSGIWFALDREPTCAAAPAQTP
jgi:hypothetical protein